ncbi:MAG: MBL fold metallo-hydrolase [Akkermansiaceae bacterium]|nr:MBL fold metallo-hydrolase [Akkermansiaceae bacterium]
MPNFLGRSNFLPVMRFTVLGSGSLGNAAVVECGGLRLMIDAGLSAKQLSLRLKQIGIEPASLNGILLTHEHGDHVRGLKVFLKQNPLPVFTTPATARVVREAGIEGGKWKFFEAGQAFAIGEIAIETFAIQHDAVDPVGFVIGHDSQRLGFLSDAGFVTRSMTERLRKLDGIFVEANYDEVLLESDTKRPWSIKQRISSRHGHLSNSQVTELIKDISHPDLKRVVLGHLSSDCNTPETILSKLRHCLGELDHHHVELHCVGQDEPSEWFHF